MDLCLAIIPLCSAEQLAANTKPLSCLAPELRSSDLLGECKNASPLVMCTLANF